MINALGDVRECMHTQIGSGGCEDGDRGGVTEGAFSIDWWRRWDNTPNAGIFKANAKILF